MKRFGMILGYIWNIIKFPFVYAYAFYKEHKRFAQMIDWLTTFSVCYTTIQLYSFMIVGHSFDTLMATILSLFLTEFRQGIEELRNRELAIVEHKHSVNIVPVKQFIENVFTYSLDGYIAKRDEVEGVKIYKLNKRDIELLKNYSVYTSANAVKISMNDSDWRHLTALLELNKRKEESAK